MTVDEVLDDLQDRLLNAAAELDRAAATHNYDSDEHKRLRAKRSGVMLALDYTRAYR